MQLFYCLNYDILHTDCLRRHQEGNAQEKGCTVVPDSNAFSKHSYSPVNKVTDIAFISMHKIVLKLKNEIEKIGDDYSIHHYNQFILCLKQ